MEKTRTGLTAVLLFGVLLLSGAPPFCRVAAAQEKRAAAGITSSKKAFGIYMAEWRDDMSFNSFSLEADLFGVLKGFTSTPGVRLNFSRNYILLTTGDPACCVYEIYAGPGISSGWVRDYELAYIKGEPSLGFEKNPGFFAALSAVFGCTFHFPRKIDLAASIMMDTGVHLRKDEKLGNLDLSFYRNGIARALEPSLTIMYKW